MPAKRKSDPAIPDVFDEFWSIYPRRIAKLAAKRKFEAALRHATAEQIIDGARAYASVTATTDMQFIKHPATWLHGGCWEDDMAVVAPKAISQSKPTFDDLARYYDAQSEREGDSGAGTVPLFQNLPRVTHH